MGSHNNGFYVNFIGNRTDKLEHEIINRNNYISLTNMQFVISKRNYGAVYYEYKSKHGF